MFQSFEVASRPDQGPPRLMALREAMHGAGVDGFIVPRADAHQGEYVARCDARLAWLTGFTGSAGFCAVLSQVAGVFIDGRYRMQVRAQVADLFTPVHWPEVKLADWLIEQLPDGGVVGFDPWLHTVDEVTGLREKLGPKRIELRGVANLVDQLWSDRPAPPDAKFTAYPLEFAGESHADKRARLARILVEAGQTVAVLTLPDSIAWLLNIRGTDVTCNPVPQAFALLYADATCDLFCRAGKADDVLVHLGDAVTVRNEAEFSSALAKLTGTVRLDYKSAPQHLADVMAGLTPVNATDPCILPKARKNAVEIAGTKVAHLRARASLKGRTITPHTLRYTAAMDLLRRGVDLSVIALWLGHEWTETTQIYLHADMKMKEQALAHASASGVVPDRFRPKDSLLSFLEAL